ncbi:hypothetical protein FJZ19_00160 [Candidatus Pacearchaeota archaeon]|nr:hypothetical protein [Candidatus Pacearchaeota archaeon]
MTLVRITEEQLAMIDGVRELARTNVSAKEIMTDSANDVKGLHERHKQELEQKIIEIAPKGADAYLLGKGKEGGFKPYGCFSSLDIEYPIIFLELPKMR